MINVKNSAKRIKALLDRYRSFPEEERGVKMQPHECKQIKAPKLSPQFFHVLLPGLLKKISERTANQVDPEWNEESRQTHGVGTHVGPPLALGADLIPHRVKRWKIKECQELARQIKAVSKQKEGADHHKVEVLDDKPKTNAQGDKKQDELWQEMMKSKEERHFQIGRITNFFS